jgi:hypothetical protein
MSSNAAVVIFSFIEVFPYLPLLVRRAHCFQSYISTGITQNMASVRFLAAIELLGAQERKDSKEISVVPLTRPAGAGHPLPLGEGFAGKHSRDSEIYGRAKT